MSREEVLQRLDQIKPVVERLDGINKEVDQLRAFVAHYLQRLEESRQALAVLEKMLQNVGSLCQSAARQAELREAAVRQLEEQLGKNFHELYATLLALRDNTAQIAGSLEEHLRALEERTQQISQLTGELEKLIDMRKAVENLLVRLNSAVSSVVQYDARLKELVASFEAVYASYVQQAEELKKREKELAEREERLRDAEAELETRRRQREAELAQLDQQIRELQAAKQMLEAEIAARKKELEKHKMDLLAAEIKRNYELYLALRDKEIRLLKWEADLQKRERACY
jgi:chromosome segregation ATPase